MRVGFFTCFRKDPQHYVLAELLIRSIRKTMPGVEVVQFTDDRSPAVLGVDSVRRKPHGQMLEVRLQHYAEAEGDWLLVDTDVLIQRDVRAVFDGPDTVTGRGVALTLDPAMANWEIAIADRNWPHAKDDLGDQGMPYNTGVVFSRSAAFWRDVLTVWQALPPNERDWLSEQRAVAKVIDSDRWNVLILPGLVFNFPPDRENPGADAAILHFKGPRKALMLERHRQRATATPEPASPTAPRPQGRKDNRGPSGLALPVFIGYDPRQPVAFQVAAHSVLARASRPVAITPLVLDQLPVKRRGLTDFTYSRFLVPYLCGFQGQAVFMDSDMLCRGDVWDLVAHAYLERVKERQEAAVWVVPHQRSFERPSVMVFENERCRTLTPEYVATARLFDFAWAERVGTLPAEWNHLVGYDATRPDAKLVHFTQGVPVWTETELCEYAEEWRAERWALLGTVSFAELMGGSVHVQHMKAVAEEIQA